MNFKVRCRSTKFGSQAINKVGRIYTVMLRVSSPGMNRVPAPRFIFVSSRKMTWVNLGLRLINECSAGLWRVKLKFNNVEWTRIFDRDRQVEENKALRAFRLASRTATVANLGCELKMASRLPSIWCTSKSSHSRVFRHGRKAGRMSGPYL
jgi:hypothetical protein